MYDQTEFGDEEKKKNKRVTVTSQVQGEALTTILVSTFSAPGLPK